MNLPHHKTENDLTDNKRVRRRSRHSKKKRKTVARIVKWITRNPLKAIGILCGLVIIYLTFLFVQLDAKRHPLRRGQNFETPK